MSARALAELAGIALAFLLIFGGPVAAIALALVFLAR